MKSGQNNRAKYLLAGIVFLGYQIFSAWNNYTWHSRYINAAGSDWAVFSEQALAVDPLHPYTLIKAPVSRIGLIQKSSVHKSLGIYGYVLHWEDKNIWSDGGSGENFVSFSDCIFNKEGRLKDGIETPSSLEDIEWYKPDENKYLTSEVERERVREQFKAKCEILQSL